MSDLPHLTADDRGVLVPCARCQKLNRIPFSRLGQTPRCGGCKKDVPHPSLPVELDSSARFQALIRESSLPVLVDFWAPWCGPCQMVAPEVSRFASLAAESALVVKVNTEANPQLGASMGIRSIPTFAVFAAGRELQRASGGMSAEQLRIFVADALQRAR